MKKTASILISLMFATATFGQVAQTWVVQNGTPKMKIFATDTKMPAAVELQRVLEKMTGAKIDISKAQQNSQGIYVGKASDFPWLKLEKDKDISSLGPEGCIVRGTGRSLLLLGGGDKGAEHAVMTFLDNLGCRWFFPGEVWEVVPKTKTVSGTWNIVDGPDFNIQRGLWYGFGAYGPNASDKQAWDRHNRMGGSVEVSIGHVSHGLTDEDFEKTPELFAMNKGVRVKGSKPCYSHPDYIKRATEQALAAAASGGQMISLTPADGLGYCECPLCHEWAKGGEVFWDKGSQFATRPDGKLVCITSESLFNCINVVADALAEKYPGVLIGTYAYSAYSHPPSFPVRPNVFIQTTTAYRRTPISLQQQLELFKEMGVQSGIRGYWSVYQWDWDGPVVSGELELPRLANDIHFYHNNNVRSLNTEMSCNWAPRGIGYYVGARMLWDVDANPKALIADFYEKAFGPAARPMERYYIRWLGEGVRVTTAIAATPVKPPRGEVLKAKPAAAEPVDELGDVEQAKFGIGSMKAAYADLDEAARLVKEMPEYKARVDHLRLYAIYLTFRLRLDEIAKTGDKDAIVKAVEAETVFGARIMKTNMIHTRPLIGKAFHRRFKSYSSYLEGLPEWPASPNDGWNKGFRVTRDDVPGEAEIEKLWAENTAWLGER